MTAKPLRQLGEEIEANLEDGENGVQVKVYKYTKLPKQGQLPAMPNVPVTAESARRQNLPAVKKGKKKSPLRNKNSDENAVYVYPEKFKVTDDDTYQASNYILNGAGGKVGLVVPGARKQRNKSNMKSRKN